MKTKIPIEVELTSIKRNGLYRAVTKGVVAWLSEEDNYNDKFYKAIRLGVRDAILTVHAFREENNDRS